MNSTNTYPDRAEIQAIFHHLSVPGKSGQFFDHVVDDVDWQIIGHTPMSGQYTSKVAFQDKTLGYLAQHVLTKPVTMRVVNVIGGEQETAAVEMVANSECKNGLEYDMKYCWVVTFNTQRRIVRVKAYLDTDLLARAIEQNT